MNRTAILVAALIAVLLAGCNDDSSRPAPAGSPENPVAARTDDAAPTSEGGKPVKAGYGTLLERQSKKPRKRFTPCNLVTKDQARGIIGKQIEDPLEAPLGPTCIYRSRDGKAFVTLAVQRLPFSKLKRQIRKPERIEVSDHTAVCGSLGRPMLHVALARRRVLSVSAPCAVASKFAKTAVNRLDR